MTNYTLTPEKALELLERVVDTKGPEYVYSDHRITVYEDGDEDKRCVYTKNGAPSCIVGHVIYNLSLEEKLDAYDYLVEIEDDTWVPSVSGLRSRGLGGIKMPDPVVSILGAAQDEQDNGFTWGEALQAARDRYADEN